MTIATLFQLSGLLTIPFWVLMIFLPHWSITKRIMQSPWVVAPAALLYTVLIIPMATSVLPAVMRPELEIIQGLLNQPMGTTVAWVHFLAFDLFVGRWVYLDSQAKGLSPWLMGLVLFFVLMLGPFGALLYLLLCIKQTAVTEVQA